MTDPRPASSIDLRCGCGAALYVECASDPYEHVVSLGKTFISAHQKCAGADFKTVFDRCASVGLPAYDVAILKAAREIVERESPPTPSTAPSLVALDDLERQIKAVLVTIWNAKSKPFWSPTGS
jgi:hypothetical protein